MAGRGLQAIVALTEDDTGEPTISVFSDDGPPSVSEERLETFAEAVWAVYDLHELWRNLGPGGNGSQGGGAGPQRPVLLRQRQEIQEVPRRYLSAAVTQLRPRPGP
jgi:hypothetical protein